MSKELLFSVTAKDCKFDYFRGSGKGGQKRNKTNSAVRCTHIESGAVGQSEDSRSQHQNKITAFKRMAETDTFKKWHKIETARRSGKYIGINQVVDKQVAESIVEIKKDGKWINEDNPENHNIE